MKSNLTNLVIAFVLLTCTSLSVELQAQSDAGATLASAESTVTFTFLQSQSSLLEADARTSHPIAVELDERAFATLLAHGFFYDGVANHMYVNTTYDSKYTRVEIISKSTKEHLFDGSLGNALTAAEIEGLQSGTYKFIFTNEAGNIKVDELNVVTIKRQDLLLANNDD